jgi:hypothetical protein
MTCNRYRDLLSRYVDGEVTPRQRRELLEHVERCRDCAAWLARVRQTDVLLNGINETQPSDRVRQVVLGSRRRRAGRPEASGARYARPGPLSGGWHLGAASILLRFDLTPRRIALASAAALLAMAGVAYWLNIFSPIWGYSQFGFLVPRDQEQTSVSAEPIQAISSGVEGRGGPVAVPNMVLVTPARGAQSVDVGEPLRIRFDQPMDRASVEDALTIDPPAAGTFGWDADNELRFSPAGAGLLKGVTYTVKLGGAARSLAGTSLAQPLEWSFRTRDPHAVTPGLAPGSSIAPTATLGLLFEEPMDAAEAGRAISLRASGSDLDLPASLSWDETATWLRIVPDTALPADEVTLHVGASARTKSGETLGQSTVVTYTVAIPTPRLRLMGGPLAITGSTASIEYEALANPDMPLGMVTFDLYSVPGDRLSALRAQERRWPAPMPAGVLETLPLVKSAQSAPAGLPDFGTRQLDGLFPGTYLLVASAPSPAGLLSDWQLLVVTNGRLAELDNAAFWATGEHGHAWAGAEISIYAASGALLEKGSTDAAGLWAPSSPDVGSTGATLAIARDLQGNLAALELEPPLGISASSGETALPATMHTDLPAYYPGQTVNFRALLHTPGSQGSWAAPAAESDASVALLNPRGSPVAALTLKPDSVGGVSGLFSLAPGLQPGQYALRLVAGGRTRDFPLSVQAPRQESLSVYIAPGREEMFGAQVVTRTVSLLGPAGQPAVSALVTATLRIVGDAWTSSPVLATTDSSGQATIAVPLPAWTGLYTEPGLYLDAQASWRGQHGSSQVALDVVSARRLASGVRDLVSPSLDLAAVAQPQVDGSTRLRLVALDGADNRGDLLVQARARLGGSQAWAIDLKGAGGDVTLTVPAEFAGSSMRFFRAGAAGSRQLALAETGDAIAVQVESPATASAGAPLPVTLGLLDREGAGVEGTMMVWLRRASGLSPDGPQSWEPSLQVAASGPSMATLVAPSTPGLWYVMAAGSTGDGTYARGWSVVNVLPGPTVQLPPTQEARSGRAGDVSIVVHNPTSESLSSSVRATGNSVVQVLGNPSQTVDVPPGGSRRLDWRYLPTTPGTSGLAFSFSPSAGVDDTWNLAVNAEEAERNEITHASGMLVGQRTVGVQVPSGMSSDVHLEIHASTSLLSALADASAGINLSAMDGSTRGSPVMAAARLSAGPSVASAYRRTGSELAAQATLPAIERSLALQQLYASQHADGGWGLELDPAAGTSSLAATADVLFALRRQSLSWSETGGEPQPGVDGAVTSRALAYLARETGLPAGDQTASEALDERARAQYAQSLYGDLKPEVVRPFLAYTASGGDRPKLSREGQAWLVLALWQIGDTEDALALLDRLLLTQPEPDARAAAPMLEALVAAGSTNWQGGQDFPDVSRYRAAAGSYARTLMEMRQGALWPSPSLSAEAFWALSRFAAQDVEKSAGAPSLTLNDRPVQASGQPGNRNTISVLVSGEALHAGTNWLKLQTPTASQPLYYSLTLRASR